jgi:tetratricopeptide (TPR) repeat protein
MLRSVVAFVGYNLFFGAVIARTDNAEHIGGLVMGLLLGALIARAAPAHDAIFQRIAVLFVGAVLVAGGVFWLARSRSYLAHQQSGLARLSAGDPDAAIRELQKSARQKPNSVDTHEALAEAYFNKGDFDNAAAEVKRAIALDPRNETAQYNLGQIYLEQKQPAKAEDAFTQLLKINPNSANGHAGMARVLTSGGHYAEALGEYKRVAEIDSLYPGINYRIGVLEARLNHPDEAIAALLKQRQTWDDAGTESVLADLYDATGRKEEAKAARAKAAELSGKK